MCGTLYSFEQYKKLRAEIDKHEGGLEKFSRGYEIRGFTRRYDFFDSVSINLEVLFFLSALDLRCTRFFFFFLNPK